MRKSLAEYHLKFLEKNEIIYSTTVSGYKRYYTKITEIGDHDRHLLGLLRQDIPMKVISLLLEHSHLKHSEISKKLSISPSALSYHLNKLMKNDLITVTKYGVERGYSVKSRKELLKFFIKYEIESVVDNIKDIWEDIY